MKRLFLSPKRITWLDEIKDTTSAKAVIQAAEKYRTEAPISRQASGHKYIMLPPFPISENKVSLGKPEIVLSMGNTGEESTP